MDRNKIFGMWGKGAYKSVSESPTEFCLYFYCLMGQTFHRLCDFIPKCISFIKDNLVFDLLL